MAKQNEKQFHAELLSKHKKFSLEKLGSDISSSEDELLTGDRKNKTPKAFDDRMSPDINKLRKMDFHDSETKNATSDTNGNCDNNMDDDQVRSIVFNI